MTASRLIKPDNPQQVQRFVEAWTRRRETPYARETFQAVMRYAREAADGVDQGIGAFGGPLASGRHRDELQAILTRRNADTARAFAKLYQNDVKSALGHETKDFQTYFEEWLARWLAQRTARQVVRIADTTRAQIAEAITIGQRDGLGSAHVARIIRERTRTIGAARALTIARTETGMVASAAGEEALNALQIERRKEWVASFGERTRPTHREADGQIRAADEAFDVGGAKLMRPLDPDGPAKEIINCRCASVAIAV
jgi:uncharacterized protein with gpF-like domain